MPSPNLIEPQSPIKKAITFANKEFDGTKEVPM